MHYWWYFRWNICFGEKSGPTSSNSICRYFVQVILLLLLCPQNLSSFSGSNVTSHQGQVVVDLYQSTNPVSFCWVWKGDVSTSWKYLLKGKPCQEATKNAFLIYKDMLFGASATILLLQETNKSPEDRGSGDTWSLKKSLSLQTNLEITFQWTVFLASS